ncbi:hypothetical protein Ancab_029333 [Ancistrocladus abbreviatus]
MLQRPKCLLVTKQETDFYASVAKGDKDRCPSLLVTMWLYLAVTRPNQEQKRELLLSVVKEHKAKVTLLYQ